MDREFIKKISDRHFGVGSDGMIVILPSDKYDFKMRMFNLDGSEGKMCGTGIVSYTHLDVYKRQIYISIFKLKNLKFMHKVSIII